MEALVDVLQRALDTCSGCHPLRFVVITTRPVPIDTAASDHGDVLAGMVRRERTIISEGTEECLIGPRVVDAARPKWDDRFDGGRGVMDTFGNWWTLTTSQEFLSSCISRRDLWWLLLPSPLFLTVCADWSSPTGGTAIVAFDILGTLLVAVWCACLPVSSITSDMFLVIALLAYGIAHHIISAGVGISFGTWQLIAAFAMGSAGIHSAAIAGFSITAVASALMVNAPWKMQWFIVCLYFACCSALAELRVARFLNRQAGYYALGWITRDSRLSICESRLSAHEARVSDSEDPYNSDGAGAPLGQIPVRPDSGSSWIAERQRTVTQMLMEAHQRIVEEEAKAAKAEHEVERLKEALRVSEQQLSSLREIAADSTGGFHEVLSPDDGVSAALAAALERERQASEALFEIKKQLAEQARSPRCALHLADAQKASRASHEQCSAASTRQPMERSPFQDDHCQADGKPHEIDSVKDAPVHRTDLLSALFGAQQGQATADVRRQTLLTAMSNMSPRRVKAGGVVCEQRGRSLPSARSGASTQRSQSTSRGRFEAVQISLPGAAVHAAPKFSDPLPPTPRAEHRDRPRGRSPDAVPHNEDRSASPPAPAPLALQCIGGLGAAGNALDGPPPKASVAGSQPWGGAAPSSPTLSVATNATSACLPGGQSFIGLRLSGFKSEDLNVLFVESKKPQHQVNGRETYWSRSGGQFIFYCAGSDTWGIAKKRKLNQVKANQHYGIAHSPPGYNLLDAATKVAGWQEWDKESGRWIIREGSGVVVRGKVRPRSHSPATSHGLSINE